MLSPDQGSPDALRIVVTDDDHNKAYVLSRTLSFAGHCIFTAYDGAAAYDLLVMLPNIHLLITNSRLGWIDGPDLVRKARAVNPMLPILQVGNARGARATIRPMSRR